MDGQRSSIRAVLQNYYCPTSPPSNSSVLPTYRNLLAWCPAPVV
jgi:hypothetical protein